MLESLKTFWNETMEITEARWVVWLTLLLVLVVTGIYLVKLFRDFAFGGRPSEADRINDMRTLKQIGALSDAEYRRAREAIAAKQKAGEKTPNEPVAFHEVSGSGGSAGQTEVSRQSGESPTE
jgi:hypothetical protein